MVFGILTRSDAAMIKVCFDDDIYALGKQLSDGHVFSVNVWAIFHDEVMGARLLKRLEPHHLASGWYDVTFTDITRLLALALNLGSGGVEEEEQEPAYDDENDHVATNIGNIVFPAPLVPCDAKYAPSATSLRAELQERLGKEDAKQILSQLKQKVRRSSDGTVGRISTFTDIPVKT